MYVLTYRADKIDYNEADDTLIAEVSLAKNHDDEHLEFFTYEESTEKFRITASFASNRYAIESLIPADVPGECEVDYLPMILCAFTQAFKNAYRALDADASPLDVFEKPFQFAFKC